MLLIINHFLKKTLFIGCTRFLNCFKECTELSSSPQIEIKDLLFLQNRFKPWEVSTKLILSERLLSSTHRSSQSFLRVQCHSTCILPYSWQKSQVFTNRSYRKTELIKSNNRVLSQSPDFRFPLDKLPPYLLQLFPSVNLIIFDIFFVLLLSSFTCLVLKLLLLSYQPGYFVSESCMTVCKDIGLLECPPAEVMYANYAYINCILNI